MALQITPLGTYGAEMPKLARYLMKKMLGLGIWYARLSGDRQVILTTTGARTGLPHRVPVGRFPEDGNSFLVVASNAGSARHPAWFINMARHPDQVWAEVGKVNFKVRPKLLTGAERDAAWQRVISRSPGYAAYPTKTDRQIPVIRLIPE